MSNILEVARQARAAMVAARKYVPDTVAIQNTMLYDQWDPNGREYVGKDKATEDNPASIVRGDDGYLYRCLTSHTSQADWAPGAAPSLWVRIDDPAVEWPEWRQPTNAEDAYPKGAKVTHNGERYISQIDANTTEPGTDERWWKKVEETEENEEAE